MVEVQQRYEASEAMAPFDFNARASASARLACETPFVDLRLRQSSPGSCWPSSPMPSDVSIRDLLGASLVTYDQHLDISDLPTTAASSPYQDLLPAIEPKAVYVQYQSQDPVTGGVSPVVVPASLSLDVFADPHWFGTTQEEEKIVEEEKDDNEEEDRQKLRSSIKGDPILMRAKPAPPPDPYFAPLRHETLHSRLGESSARGASSWSSSKMAWTEAELQEMSLGTLRGLCKEMGLAQRGVKAELVERIREAEKKIGQASSGHTSTRHVEGSATMSSFLKASGKDKFSRSRITEIDQILRSPNGREQADLVTPQRPSSSPQQSNNVRDGLSSPRSRRCPFTSAGVMQSPRSGSGAWRDTDSSALAAQMAMYIQRMPQFHRGKLARFSSTDLNGAEMDASEIGDGLGNVGTNGGVTVANGEDGENGRGSPGSQVAPPELPPSPSTAAAALGSTPGAQQQSDDIDSESPRHGSLKRGSHVDGRCRNSGSRALCKKLRDLDPHIDISESVPTQRLHSNWPDGLRRQLARHFYGLSPAQILEEEEKERIRERRAVRGKDPTAEMNGETATDEAVVDEARSAKAKARREAERRGLERSFARADGGVMPHRLEVRIRNVARPERVVVGLTTGHGESTSRACTILDELRARKYLKY